MFFPSDVEVVALLDVCFYKYDSLFLSLSHLSPRVCVCSQTHNPNLQTPQCMHFKPGVSQIPQASNQPCHTLLG